MTREARDAKQRRATTSKLINGTLETVTLIIHG